jgi:hypothetical protein
MLKAGKDMCYHFDDENSDCSRCELGFTGKNCQYICDKCLMGGYCSNAPSDIRSAGCTCKDLNIYNVYTCTLLLLSVTWVIIVLVLGV